jgi:hypothetical protein
MLGDVIKLSIVVRDLEAACWTSRPRRRRSGRRCASFSDRAPHERLMDMEPRLDSGSQFERTLGYLVEHAPSFSLRGGTREILRGIIARGLGLR